MIRKNIVLLFSALTISIASVGLAGDTSPLPVCLLRDAATSCASLLGIAYGGSPTYCDSCTAGEMCSGESKSVNPSITKAQYEKNRATSVKLTLSGGFAVGTFASVNCGTISSCNVRCEIDQVGGSQVHYCPVVPEPAYILFFNLSKPCPVVATPIGPNLNP